MAVALPAAAVLVVLNHVGGLAFSLPLAALGAVGLVELARMPRLPWWLKTVAAMWLALCLVHAVLLRDLTHGAALVIAVLLATFLGDTAAQLVGSAFGRRRLAPRISPNKTLEGLLAGTVTGTAACWLFALLFHDWLTGSDGLLLGAACACAAPAGDLLESALKRRAGVKDSGRVFGAHGGVLDRIDAAAAAAVAGYYVAAALT